MALNRLAAKGARDLANLQDKTTLGSTAKVASVRTNRYVKAVKLDVLSNALETISRSVAAGSYQATIRPPYNKLNLLAQQLNKKKYDVFLIETKVKNKSYLIVFWYGKSSPRKIYGKDGTVDQIIQNFIISELPTDNKVIKDVEWLGHPGVIDLEKLLSNEETDRIAFFDEMTNSINSRK